MQEETRQDVLYAALDIAADGGALPRGAGPQSLAAARALLTVAGLGDSAEQIRGMVRGLEGVSDADILRTLSIEADRIRREWAQVGVDWRA